VNPGILVAMLEVPLTGALICATPAIGRPTLQFGVRVPADHAAMPVVRAERRAFYWRTAAVTACCTTVAVLVAGRGSVWPVWLVQLAQLLADLGCFGLARNKIAAAKQAGGWFAGRRQVVTTDTSWRTSPARFPVRWLAPAVTVIAVTVVIGMLRHPDLPPVPGRSAARSSLGGYGPVIGQLYVTALWTGLLLIIYRSRPDVDAADPARSARQYRRFLGVMARAMLTLVTLVDLSLLLSALRRWQIGHIPAAVTVLPFVTGLLVLAVVSLRTGQGGSRLSGSRLSDGRGPGPAMVADRDDDRFWKAGLIYVNRDDPAIMVTRRFGVGWTFNLGNRLAWLVVGGIVGGLAGLLILRAVLGPF